MATFNKEAATTQRKFIGRAWINTVKKDGANKGVQFLSFKLDRGVQVTLDDADQIQLWPNKKREGRADPDYRASIQVAA